MKLEKTLPKVTLRGYGTVSGNYYTAVDGGAILEIACETEQHAKLTLAKYVSDLQVLPGVKPAAGQLGKTDVTIYEAKGQGYITALRTGANVLVLAAPVKAALEKLAAALKGSWAGVTSTAEVPVPMWLDRFDKHGFRFYYAPFTFPRPEQMPQGVPVDRYDFTKDFEFARDHKTGLVMWSVLSKEGAAEGIKNDSWLAWGQQLGQGLEAPAGRQS